MEAIKLAQEIIEGRRLNKNDDISEMLSWDIDAFAQGADMIREKYMGDRVNLCSIISGKSGNCGEDCKFCAQSAHNRTGCEVYPLLDADRILEEAAANEKEGVDRFAIVISGKSPSPSDFEKLTEIYERLGKELHIGLCASLGFLTSEQFERLYEVGVRNYHNNIETSRKHFSEICTTHSFDDKIANIKRAAAAGLSVCSGGIIGMGEDWSDRIDMAFTLSELGIKSIPINCLIPIPHTPLEGLERLGEEDILRTVCIFRYINPEADIRLAAGRSLIGNNGRRAFEAGASASLTGNMLTTTGSTIQMDRAMLKEMGRKISGD